MQKAPPIAQRPYTTENLVFTRSIQAIKQDACHASDGTSDFFAVPAIIGSALSG